MKYKKVIALVLSSVLVWTGCITTAAAAVVSTGEALNMERPTQPLAAVQARLASRDVQQAMIALGVDPVEAQLRVAALDQRELAQLQGHLDELPAGGILALIGAVFVVLLILEYTGVIDIFKKT